MIPELRKRFNHGFTGAKYAAMRARLEQECETHVGFRVAETPVFVPKSLLQEMADEGARLAQRLIADPAYLNAARAAIPRGYCVADETPHPNFLTADFALVQDQDREAGNADAAMSAFDLVPKLVEMQAFPSVYGFQAALCEAYHNAYALDENLDVFLGGLDEKRYWELLRQTIVGSHDPENVALAEIDPEHQKTLPDFNITARRLGIAVVDIARLEPAGNRLHYRNPAGKLVPIHRIYNRAIAEELIARGVRLPFDWTLPWDVEWAGHPNWYFLISKFSVPWLADREVGQKTVPPAVFLDEFLEGAGREKLAHAGVKLPPPAQANAAYSELLLKPLFSFAGKGIQFEPTQDDLEAIPRARRSAFILQQRMHFVPTIETPHGMTQAEFRILYLWPEGAELMPVLSLVRLGRGKMMGVDHNRDMEWVGASAAFHPGDQAR